MHIAAGPFLLFHGRMGGIKRDMELAEDRGWSDTGTTICSDCVTDCDLIAAVCTYGRADPCDYCGATPAAPQASAPFELVLELVVDGLKYEYEDPVEAMAWDDGYVGTVHDTWDLILDLEITDRTDVHDDLIRAITTGRWCQRGPYTATPAEALAWGWEAFRRYVKHKRRFTFLTTDHSATDGAGMLPMHAMPSAIANAVESAGLVIHLPPGTNWWRVRSHPTAESYCCAADLGTPPDCATRDNRMTPKGIGAFYGASTAMGARAEVAGYADPADGGSIGRFTTTTQLTVVDLRDVPDQPSLFDPARRHLRAPIEFLQGFVKDATEVAHPDDHQNLEYIPTQVIAETFRYELGVDGILWRSRRTRP